MAAEVSNARKLVHRRSMDCVLRVEGAAPRLRMDQLRHTYSENSVLSPRIKSVDIRMVARHPDVYTPSNDTFALADALLSDRNHLKETLQPKLCVEIGSGSGYVISSLALMLHDEVESHYIATDISQAATETTALTLKQHGVSADVVCTDLITGLESRLTGNVDLLIANPVFVDEGEVIERLLEVADMVVSCKGWFYLVALTTNNLTEICRRMKRKGFGCRIVVQRVMDEQNIYVLRFWREHPSNTSCKSPGCVYSSSSDGSSLLCLPQKISRLAFWRS